MNTLLYSFDTLFVDTLLYSREKEALLAEGVLQRIAAGKGALAYPVAPATSSSSDVGAAMPPLPHVLGKRGRWLKGEDTDPLADSHSEVLRLYHHFGAKHLLRFLLLVLVKPCVQGDGESIGERDSTEPATKKARIQKQKQDDTLTSEAGE